MKRRRFYPREALIQRISEGECYRLKRPYTLGLKHGSTPCTGTHFYFIVSMLASKQAILLNTCFRTIPHARREVRMVFFYIATVIKNIQL